MPLNDGREHTYLCSAMYCMSLAAFLGDSIPTPVVTDFEPSDGTNNSRMLMDWRMVCCTSTDAPELQLWLHTWRPRDKIKRKHTRRKKVKEIGR